MDTSQTIIRSLLRLGAFLSRTGNRITEEFDLNQQQFVLLTEIVEKETVNQKQIVAELLLEKSNVSKMVKKLYQKALISISKSPSDMRTTILSPTEKGRLICATCMDRLKAWNQTCLRNLHSKDAKDAAAILGKLEQAMLNQSER